MSNVDPENGDPLENAEDPENGDLLENPQPEEDFQTEGTTNGNTVQVSSQPVPPETQESNPEPESEFGCHGNHEQEGSTGALSSDIRDNKGDISNSHARLDTNISAIVGELRCVSPVSVNDDTGMDCTNRIPEDDRNSNSEVEDNASDAEDGICVEEMCKVEGEEGEITVEPCEADQVSGVETVSSSNEEAQLCSSCSGDNIQDAEEMSDCHSVKSCSVSPSRLQGAYRIKNQSQEPCAVQNGANGLSIPEDEIDVVGSHGRNVETGRELCEPECDQSSTDANTAMPKDTVESSEACESQRSLNGCISVNGCCPLGESDRPSYLQASGLSGIESDHSSGEASCSAQGDRLVLSQGSLLHAEMNGQEQNNDRKPNGHECNSSAFYRKNIQDSASSTQKASNVDASNVHHSKSGFVASDKDSHTGNDCATLTCQNLNQNVSTDLNKDASVSPKHSISQERTDNSLLEANNGSLGKLTSSESMNLVQASKGPNVLLKVSDLSSCTIDVSHDSEEELLSELDATLQCSPQTSAHCDINGDVMDKNCDNIAEEEIPIQKDIMALRDLKHQLRQAKQLLLQRECEISRLREENVEQNQRLDTALKEQDRHLREINILRKQNSDDLYIPQIKELEYTIAQQQTEIRVMKEKLASHDASAKRAIVTLQNEVKLRVDQVTKTCDEAVKEKDAMVVRYAQAEHKNLEYQKLVERLEVKIKESEREKETFFGKIKDLKEQKHKVACDLEAKNSELGNTIRELEKHREMVSSSENRVKWAQNKLRAELEAHKDTKVILEKTIAKLNQAKEETQQIRKDCQAMIKTYQESEEIKSNSLDKELRQKESELMLHLQQKSSQEEQYSNMVKGMESLKEKHKETMTIMLALQDKVKNLECEKQKHADTMHKYEEIIQRQKKDMKDLQDRIEKLVHAKEEFNRAQEVIKNLDGEIAELKMNNKDLTTDIEACRRREAEKLELTEKLSHKNAELQSENTNLSNKVLALTGEIQTISIEHQDQESKLKELADKLAQVQKERQEEVTSLKDQLSEKNKTVNDLSRKVEDGRDEIRTLKRKHASNVKDLTRQLQQVRRKLESYEVSTNGERDTTSLGSRTSSNGSLNTVGTSAEQTSSNAVVSYQSGHHLQQQTSEEHEYPVITEQVQVDRQIIIERIVKLQRALARKNEKIEFMDDHISHLVDELQKKNKIIQHYALREESGTMTADFMDRNKVELSKKHSIMGSLYSSHSMDGTMTIDLSLEINRKLQAVLEDTLLKNITLKESLDTLGQEIARLSQENRSLQLKRQEKTKDQTAS